MPNKQMSTKPESGSYILFFFYMLLLLTRGVQANCKNNKAMLSNVDNQICPEPKALTFFPLSDTSVYGHWRGENEDGVKFKSYKAPDGVTSTSGRAGIMLKLQRAMLTCSSLIVQCHYILKDTYGREIPQRLISEEPVVEEDFKLEL